MLPSVPGDNLEGYKASDITAKAEKLKGKKYLMVHGTAGQKYFILSKFNNFLKISDLKKSKSLFAEFFTGLTLFSR